MATSINNSEYNIWCGFSKEEILNYFLTSNHNLKCHFFSSLFTLFNFQRLSSIPSSSRNHSLYSRPGKSTIFVLRNANTHRNICPKGLVFLINLCFNCQNKTTHTSFFCVLNYYEHENKSLFSSYYKSLKASFLCEFVYYFQSEINLKSIVS